MCNWCNKKTIGFPQVSGFNLPMTCEHCGTKIDKRLSYENAMEWVIEFYEMYNKDNINYKGYFDCISILIEFIKNESLKGNKEAIATLAKWDKLRP